MLEVLFEGERAVGVRMQAGGRRRARSAGQGRRRRQRAEHAHHRPARPARVGPVLEEGRALDLLEGRLSRHGPGRRRDARHPDRRARTAGSGTSRCTTTSSASASWPTTTTCSRTATTKDHEAIYFEEVAQRPGLAAADRERDALRHLPGCRRSTPTARSRRPATAGCWSATPSASSTRSIPPACCSR